MSRKLVADNDNVIIKPKEGNKDLGYGIIKADMGEELPQEGVVISVGPGAYSITGGWIPTTVKKGEEVIIPKFGVSRFPVDGEEYLITKEKEICAHWEYEDKNDKDGPKDF